MNAMQQLSLWNLVPARGPAVQQHAGSGRGLAEPQAGSRAGTLQN